MGWSYSLPLKDILFSGHTTCMRTIYRDIVGGFIFSRDGKLLLGKNRKGGVYEGCYVVPGGGVEAGETNEQALQREMKEETGIAIVGAKITAMGTSTGEHQKTLAETEEVVNVKMTFHDFRIDLGQDAATVTLTTEDDWHEAEWFLVSELDELKLSQPTCKRLIAMGLVNL